MAQNQLAM